MEKNWSIGPTEGEGVPDCKKIQNYIYRFSDQIGMGNFSKVYKGINQTTNKQVAIKIIELSSLTNKRVQELLNTETKILKMISHQNIIGCQEILSSANNCYIIAELCNEGDLEKKLKRVGPFKEESIYHIALDVYEGLKYLDKKHIVHRDLKISNIFLNNGIHKIADFGFAQIASHQFKDISVGSPMYMSPEGYIHNVYGPKTDVWAFGVMLFELVEGRTPCQDCRTEADLKNCLLKQIQPSSFTSNISQELQSLIIRCLSINPAQRIAMIDIEKTEWMKKAKKKYQDDDHVKKDSFSKKEENGQRTGRTLLQLDKNLSDVIPANVLVSPVANNKNSFIKNYSNKFSNFMKSEDQGDKEIRKRHSTLDKGVQKSSQNETQQVKGSNPTKIFYSPKNNSSNFEYIMAKATNPNRFETVSFKNNFKNSENPNFSKLQTQYISSIPQKEQAFQRKSSWIEKHPNDESNLKNFSDKFQKYQKGRERKSSKLTLNNTLKFTEPKQDDTRQVKKLLGNDSKSTLSNIHSGTSTPSHKTAVPSISQQLSRMRQRRQEFMENRSFRPLNNNSNLKQTNREEQKSKYFKLFTQIAASQNSQRRSSNSSKVFVNRSLKFVDSIGIIHYCRLCYKFACLLEQCGGQEEYKQFLTQWAVQLLLELNFKIDCGDIQFVSEISLLNNPSTLSSGDHDKKKKLRDVTSEYLNKYQQITRSQTPRPSVTLKDASSFIYSIYLNKGHEFKQKAKDKKSHLYYALLCYLSTLDRETRNLMEFVYEIKSSLDGRFIERLLNIKISEFNEESIQQITKENGQNIGQL